MQTAYLCSNYYITLFCWSIFREYANAVKLSQEALMTYETKYLDVGANFVHVYLEIWDKGILKFNKF